MRSQWRSRMPGLHRHASNGSRSRSFSMRRASFAHTLMDSSAFSISFVKLRLDLARSRDMTITDSSISSGLTWATSEDLRLSS
eukprot:5909698-Pyramimonas_sp.AAC.1